MCILLNSGKSGKHNAEHIVRECGEMSDNIFRHDGVLP